MKYKRLIRKARKDLLKNTNKRIYSAIDLIDLCMLSDMAEKVELLKNDDGAIRCSFIKGDEYKGTINVGLLTVSINGSKGSIKLIYEAFDNEPNANNPIKVTMDKEGNGEDIPISKILSERTTNEFIILRPITNPKTTEHLIIDASYSIFKESITIIVETIIGNLRDRLLK